MHRSLSTYLPLGIMGLVLLVGFSFPGSFFWLFPAGVVTVLVVSLILQASIFRRLAELDLLDEYVKRFRWQSAWIQIGNIVALAMITYGVMITL